MNNVVLGKTGIASLQNAFGALPIQRVDEAEAIKIIRRAYRGGMTFFDTARVYSNSEEKLGKAFEGIDRTKYYLATKTTAKSPEAFWADLHTSLKLLKTDYVDIYQLHCADKCYAPDDGTGLYECMLEAKKQGKIKNISITCHKINVAFDCVNSGLYATMQFPFSYLANEKDIELVKLCAQKNVGFIAMKGLSGGLITDAEAAYAFISQYPNVLPIWGVQKSSELEKWLSFFDNEPKMDERIRNLIENDKKELSGSFCRGCGYCMPCPQGITINQCARMSLMLRRAPAKAWLNDYWQAEMKKIENCIACGACTKKCPYSLDAASLLKKNYNDYFDFLQKFNSENN